MSNDVYRMEEKSANHHEPMEAYEEGMPKPLTRDMTARLRPEGMSIRSFDFVVVNPDTHISFTVAGQMLHTHQLHGALAAADWAPSLSGVSLYAYSLLSHPTADSRHAYRLATHELPLHHWLVSIQDRHVFIAHRLNDSSREIVAYHVAEIRPNGDVDYRFRAAVEVEMRTGKGVEE